MVIEMRRGEMERRRNEFLPLWIFVPFVLDSGGTRGLGRSRNPAAVGHEPSQARLLVRADEPEPQCCLESYTCSSRQSLPYSGPRLRVPSSIATPNYSNHDPSFLISHPHFFPCSCSPCIFPAVSS